MYWKPSLHVSLGCVLGNHPAGCGMAVRVSPDAEVLLVTTIFFTYLAFRLRSTKCAAGYGSQWTRPLLTGNGGIATESVFMHDCNTVNVPSVAGFTTSVIPSEELG